MDLDVDFVLDGDGNGLGVGGGFMVVLKELEDGNVKFFRVVVDFLLIIVVFEVFFWNLKLIEGLDMFVVKFEDLGGLLLNKLVLEELFLFVVNEVEFVIVGVSKVVLVFLVFLFEFCII